ncbi:MAG: acyl-ACP--UDP-N-acetylglucosamine O-acyltransferase [Cocleimonas sp.]|nr:acyl-ACP--UDP-N-acetylglucosamine O-acyltransferase [Cocleimonas sp.]
MIHPTAIIASGATLAADVSVGAYSVIGEHVSIDSGTWIAPHVVIQGHTSIGKDNKIYQFSSIGEIPQDKKYQGEATQLIIGDRNVIRECCTFNTGTAQDIGKTVLGDDNWIMAYVHLAHDCIIGNHTIFANNATLAGHVIIKDYVILGGFSLIHQFCHLGEYAFTGMGAAVTKDLPPYMIAAGFPTSEHGINKEGLRRHGFDKAALQRINDAHKIIYRKKLALKEALLILTEKYSEHADVMLMVEACHQSKRGLLR